MPYTVLVSGTVLVLFMLYGLRRMIRHVRYLEEIVDNTWQKARSAQTLRELNLAAVELCEVVDLNMVPWWVDRKVERLLAYIEGRSDEKIQIRDLNRRLDTTLP